MSISLLVRCILAIGDEAIKADFAAADEGGAAMIETEKERDDWDL